MITKGVNMNYLEIAGEKYGSDDLVSYAATKLSEIGVNSFQSIQINTENNHIAICFDTEEDALIACAIAGFQSRINSNVFQSDDATDFLISLQCTASQAGFC
ncbi:hypothetical protein HQ531_11830 [bacterium]|nr:hypothetical protein [bacterium]